MIALNGRPCSRATLHVPWRGRWVATIAVDGAAPSGRVTLTWGTATLNGSVESNSAGGWQGLAEATIVGGLGWGGVLPSRWHQNAAGLTGAAVAQQVAQLAGESLVAPATAFRALRTSYTRPRRTAAASLDDVLATGALWWVEFDGTTRAGTRSSPPASPRVEILEFDPASGRAQLDAEDVGQPIVGSVIAAAPPRRQSAYRIVELRAEVSDEGQRFTGWLEAA